MILQELSLNPHFHFTGENWPQDLMGCIWNLTELISHLYILKLRICWLASKFGYSRIVYYDQ